ncbi:conserved hypothetical protein [Staphylococcus aureus subsp. aureus str. Newman]|uniref:Uncharacterized protein n=2 Tax=Staphylococcus aureus TaxID=1280 RepID=A0A0H3KED9_STAAE|nr:Hypothetical protein SA1_2515 [Staphylococcus aureus subsp. aureus PSP1996]BAF66657.1 conserved hypothetical protein [Staphylococcus aureus subsp. aureus str. Newman]
MQSQNSNHLRTELKITHKKQIHFLNYMKTKNLNHFIYSISNLRNAIKDNALFHNYISQETKTFQTSLNPSIAHSLKHKAITMNDQNSLRTYDVSVNRLHLIEQIL